MTTFEISNPEITKAIESDKVAKRISKSKIFPTVGQCVGVRLNLNILKNTGVAIQTIHQATKCIDTGYYRGKVLGYAGMVVLKDAQFNVNQKVRESIASGFENKSPMASVDGELVSWDQSLTLLDKPLEIRFNPKKTHLFVNLNNQPIHKAEHVMVLGHRAYVWGNIAYYTSATAPKPYGKSPSLVALPS